MSDTKSSKKLKDKRKSFYDTLHKYNTTMLACTQLWFTLNVFMIHYFPMSYLLPILFTLEITYPYFASWYIDTLEITYPYFASGYIDRFELFLIIIVYITTSLLWSILFFHYLHDPLLLINVHIEWSEHLDKHDQDEVHDSISPDEVHDSISP